MSDALSKQLEGAIARPDVPRHFMVLRDVGQRVVVRHGGNVLADSTDARWLMEAGKTLYAPVIYLPRDDVTVDLQPEDKTTHCPLKGDASYFGFGDVESIAWTYEEPLDFSAQIKGLVAFYPDKASIELHPA